MADSLLADETKEHSSGKGPEEDDNVEFEETSNVTWTFHGKCWKIKTSPQNAMRFIAMEPDDQWMWLMSKIRVRKGFAPKRGQVGKSLLEDVDAITKRIKEKAV